jgi:hypothetical protein
MAGAEKVEDIFDIFSSLPFPSGTVNTPKNVMRIDDFYQAPFFNDRQPQVRKFPAGILKKIM